MYHFNKLVSVLLVVSVALSLCNGASIYPKTLRTQKGSASTTSLTALQKQDQSGSQDSWSKYVEFYGSSSAYSGVFTFDVSSVDAHTVSSFSLDVNFKGPKSSSQVWQFELYEPTSDSWVVAGDNTAAASWTWTLLSFRGSVSFSSLIKDGNVQVRFTSKTSSDDCDLDYLAIVTNSGSVTGAPTSAPTTAPTSAPTATPTTRPTAAPTSAPTAGPTARPTTAAPTTAPTTKPTTPPTVGPTTKPTTAPTVPPTTKPTAGPTSTPTTKPTAGPTSTPTTKPTAGPTAAPTAGPTTAPTIKPTTKPTNAPTAGPTAAPTTAPTSAPAPGGRICPAGTIWAPHPGTTWQWQLTGTIDQTVDVQMYDIDLFDNTAATIASLHSKGRAVICYFSTQYENWRPDAASFTSAVLGSNLDNWPGERYVDIRSPVVRAIMQSRLDLAVSKGCDGVEPDNVDSYSNSNGLGITAADQINFNTFMATEAHKRGLSVGLKNDLDQVAALVSKFDWALNEQCNQYGECGSLTPFVTANKAVFGTEYSGSASSFCPTMLNDKFSWLLKSLDLGAPVTQCCQYATGGCAAAKAAATHSCVSYNSKRTDIDEVEVVEIVQQPSTEVEYDSAASTMFPAAAIAVVVLVALVL